MMLYGFKVSYMIKCKTLEHFLKNCHHSKHERAQKLRRDALNALTVSSKEIKDPHHNAVSWV